MGWKEGEGLGRRKNGIKSHLKARKRVEEEGLGHDKLKIVEASTQWWSVSINDTLARLQQLNQSQRSHGKKKDGDKEEQEENMRKKRGTKKRKKQGSHTVQSSTSVIAGTVRQYTDEELFIATGGARFGMRAQRRAVAKWSRTETGTQLQEMEKRAKQSIVWDGRGQANFVPCKAALHAKTSKCSTGSTTNVKLISSTTIEENNEEAGDILVLNKDCANVSSENIDFTEITSNEENVLDEKSVNNCCERRRRTKKKNKSKKRKKSLSDSLECCSSNDNKVEKLTMKEVKKKSKKKKKKERKIACTS